MDSPDKQVIKFTYINQYDSAAAREYAFEGMIRNLERHYLETDSGVVIVLAKY
ncbi:hypothetical protein [Candidatus Vallotiella sp. (ex Adelges kitamiensis)]|uniref:hypothetical protein n=1 Tax=Candidatus Vallotiella sp. (ex Adelges kitamiensis) TaxID=2864217 RepID=UPI001EEFE93B|nr:hypothetical protein [Candidatus Vallotia sp. (ex Adelges kitamiensis)]